MPTRLESIVTDTRPVPKGFVGGTQRTRAPAETIADYARFMPAMGITRLANITGLDLIGLPVYTAIRPNARCLSTSQGKGVDHASAKASALMETIEFWHAEFIEESRLRWETPARLRRREAILDLEAMHHRGPVAPDVPMLWIEGYCLLERRPVWVPFELVTLAKTDLGGVATHPFAWSSTGLASGNHLIEAIVHALCEILERHSEATFEGKGARLDPASVTTGIAADVVAMLRRANVGVQMWDCTHPDIGVPTYEARVLEVPRGPRTLGVHDGSGCHLSAEIALSRAVTEAVQSRLTWIAGSRDDLTWDTYCIAHDGIVHQMDWETARKDVDMKAFEPVSSATDDLRRDLDLLLAAAKRGGATQAVVVDLTCSDFEIPVVKVVVPELLDHI